MNQLKEIVERFLNGACDHMSAIKKIEDNIDFSYKAQARRDAIIANSAISFVKRYYQYNTGNVSLKDLFLAMRDIIKLIGSLTVSDSMYENVQKYGGEFELVCESNNEISANLTYPYWIKNKRFADDVYSLVTPLQEDDSLSCGDGLLLRSTVFSDYKSFEQKLAVHTALGLPEGDTLLISLPTGGGKSLITQMIVSNSQGLTLVIVPTVALALDQKISAEKNLRIHEGVFSYQSDMNSDDTKRNERKKLFDALEDHTARALFTSPEAILRNKELSDRIAEAAQSGYLKNLVIDEAHIVPDWGNHFRPDFQLLSIKLKNWQRDSQCHIRTYLLSATLSDDVVDTLFMLYGSEGHNYQYRCDALRKEPRFYYHEVKSEEKQIDSAIEAIFKLPKPMVVYTLTPGDAKRIQHRLAEKGFKNIPIFTGETDDVVREEILRGWKDCLFDVIIATSAFGIGVDKSNVRTVVHACVPENLSRFYQEVGRGGRDGFPSLSVLIYNSGHPKGDLEKTFSLVGKVLKEETMSGRWFAMTNAAADLGDGTYLLDTHVASLNMNDEQKAVVGEQNSDWNINLLLLLYRRKYINILEVEYNSETRSFFFTIQILKPEELANEKALIDGIAETRASESALQREGYENMKRFIHDPTKHCWNKHFQKLYPLSAYSCSGCPKDEGGKFSSESGFSIREAPDYPEIPYEKSSSLRRLMGNYDHLIINKDDFDIPSSEYEDILYTYFNEQKFGILVVGEVTASSHRFKGLVCTFEEYMSVRKNASYMFGNGVLFMLDSSTEAQAVVMTMITHKDSFPKVFCCKSDYELASMKKQLRDVVDCYVVDIDKISTLNKLTKKGDTVNV